MRKHAFLLLFALSGAAILAGCAKKDAGAPGTGTPTVDTDAYAGWKTITAKSGSFSLKFPPEYVSGAEADEASKKGMEEVAKTHPDLAASVNAAQANSQIDLYAIDLSKESVSDGFADNVNVIVETWAPSGDVAELLKKTGEETIKTMPSSTPMVGEMIEIGNIPVFKYTGSMEFPGANGSKLTSDLTGFLIPHDGKVLIVSMSTKTGDKDKAAANFEKIARSITFN